MGSGKLTLLAYSVNKNKATRGNGGGIYISKGNVTVSSGVSISNNSATNGNGGGIFNLAGSLDLTNETIGPDNSAINGGGMYLGKASTTWFTGVTVSGNTVTGKGKGVAYEQNATMNGLPAGLTDPDDNGTPVQV